jgi:hypothetical protein
VVGRVGYRLRTLRWPGHYRMDRRLVRLVFGHWLGGEFWLFLRLFMPKKVVLFGRFMAFLVKLVADIPHDFVEFIVFASYRRRGGLVQRDVIDDVRFKSAIGCRRRMAIWPARWIHD